MNPADQTSLDRYLLNNGFRLLGVRMGPRGARFQVVFGAVLTVLSLVGGLLGFLYGLKVAIAMSGPFIAGFVNLLVGLSVLKSLGGSPIPADVKLSPEAKSLLHSTLNKMGKGLLASQERYQQYQSRPGMVMVVGVAGFSPPTFRSSKEVLTPRAFALLEEASRECNRIQACISGSTHASISRRAPQIATAADEGMAYVLQQAALLDKFPESGTAVETSARQQIVALREIADRLEELHTREPLLTERMESTSTVDRVLDDLRLESLARTELSSERVEDVHQRLGES